MWCSVAVAPKLVGTMVTVRMAVAVIVTVAMVPGDDGGGGVRIFSCTGLRTNVDGCSSSSVVPFTVMKGDNTTITAKLVHGW
jgi:hypothetical protein